jgi:hypothetical protein
MSKKKIFDEEGMSELFDIPNEVASFGDADIAIVDEKETFELSTETDEDLDLIGETTEEREVVNFLKDMYQEVKEIIGVAKYLVEASPDAETIQSAAKMFASASQLLKELNKGILESKKQRFTERLERMKIDARTELMERKAELEANSIPSTVAEGGVVNITQNNMVAFSQEDVIRQLSEMNKPKK